MLAGSHRNAWPDETGTGGRTNQNTQQSWIGVEGKPAAEGGMLFSPKK